MFYKAPLQFVGVSCVALETNKMDKALVGVSVSNLNNTIGGLGVIAIGTQLSTAALESNKTDKL